MESARWHAEMGSAKLFVKKYREAMRSRAGQTTKLGLLGDLALKTYTFVLSVVKPSPSFVLTSMRCQFFNDDGSRSLMQRLNELIDNNLFGILGEVETACSGHGKADGWLRSLVVQNIVDTLSSTAAEDVGQHRTVFKQSCAEAADLLSTAKDGLALESVISDLREMSKLFAAGSSDGTKLTEIVAAEEHMMSTPRLALLRSALTESPNGQEIMAPLAALKSSTVNDELGDQRFSIGFDFFADGAMLKVEQPAQTCEGFGPASPCPIVVANALLVTGSPMLLTNMLTDALANVVEGINLWSPLRMESSQDKLIKFIHHMSLTITAAEFALVHDLYWHLQTPFQELQEGAGKDVSQLEHVVKAVGMAYKSASPSTTADLISRFSALANHLHDTSSLQPLMKKLIIKARHNHCVHMKLRSVLESMACVAGSGIPSSTEGLVEQWIGKEDDSCLAMSIALNSAVEELKQAGAFDFADLLRGEVNETEDKVYMASPVVMKEDRVEDFDEGDYIQLKSMLFLPQDVLNLSIVGWAATQMADSVSVLLGKFTGLVELDGVVFDAEGGHRKHTTLEGLISNLVAPKRLAASVSSMRKILASKQVYLQSRSACDLLDKLLLASAHERVKIGYELTKTPGEVSSEVVTLLCQAYSYIHHIAAALAWVSTTCNGPSGCTVDKQLKEDLETTLDIIVANVGDFEDLHEEYNPTIHKMDGGRTADGPAHCANDGLLSVGGLCQGGDACIVPVRRC
jgi:hypothetical protein